MRFARGKPLEFRRRGARQPGRALRPRRWWLLVAGTALAGNAGWEVAQMPLYASSHPLLGCLRAAVVDAGLTLAAVAIARRRAGDPSGLSWPTLWALLLAAGAAFEAWALAGGRWAYGPAMPTIAGVGLVPLLQLPVISSIAVLLAGRLSRTPAHAR